MPPDRGGPVFVVSTGRTATQFVARFFAATDAEGLHEPGPWWLRHVSNAYVSGRLDHDRAVEAIGAQRSMATPDGYVEASCLIYGLVGPLLDARPDAHVVHAVRDPRTYIASALDWGVHRPAGRPLNLALYRRLALPQQYPWRLGERWRWARRGQFARLTWSWSAMNRAMREQGAGRDRFSTVRFEDLTDADRGADVLRDLAATAGVVVDEEQLATATSRRVNASGADAAAEWRSWSDRRLRLLVADTAEEAAHYGYDVGPEVEALLAARRP